MRTITPNQVKIIQIARRQVERASGGVFDESAYQIALRNCGGRPDQTGRCSSKSLSQVGFEKFMSLLEEMGFRDTGKSPDHWRRRNSQRTGLATTRQVFEIHRLAPMQKYPVAALCLRVSNNTHAEPNQLTQRQAYDLIEALKAAANRSPRGKSCLLKKNNYD